MRISNIPNWLLLMLFNWNPNFLLENKVLKVVTNLSDWTAWTKILVEGCCNSELDRVLHLQNFNGFRTVTSSESATCLQSSHPPKKSKNIFLRPNLKHFLNLRLWPFRNNLLMQRFFEQKLGAVFIFKKIISQIINKFKLPTFYFQMILMSYHKSYSNFTSTEVLMNRSNIMITTWDI